MWALKRLHEKNWRESLRVLEFHHPTKISLNSCSHSGISEYNGLPRSIVVSFLFGFLGFIGLGFIRLPWSIINRSWHLHWRGVTVNPIFSFSNLNFTYCRWRRRGWRGWWGMTLLSRRCLWSRWRSRGRTWQAWNHNRNEVLRIARYPNPVFWWDVVFDHWTIRRNIRFHRKAFQATILLACFRGLS